MISAINLEEKGDEKVAKAKTPKALSSLNLKKAFIEFKIPKVVLELHNEKQNIAEVLFFSSSLVKPSNPCFRFVF